MSNRKIILIGGGGHALSVAAAIEDDIIGYVDIQPNESLPWPYLGTDDEFLKTYNEGDIIITLVADKHCDLYRRSELIRKYDHLITRHHVSPGAFVDASVKIGEGSVILRHAMINCNTSIGRHCVINTGAIVEHQCSIGNNVFIGPGAVICGGVMIGDNVYIGANATLRPGIKVASGAIIGLGAAVVSDIESAGVYAGVPAKCKENG